MPNNVYNQLLFETHAEREIVWHKITTEDEGGNIGVDFNTLIPTPPHVYQGHLSKYDHDDFDPFTWYEWNRANWNTKWNAYQTELAPPTIIQFQTAWSPPYPFIIAVANTFEMPFIHRYMCEWGEYWGEDKWENGKRKERLYEDFNARNGPHFERIFRAIHGDELWQEIEEE